MSIHYFLRNFHGYIVKKMLDKKGANRYSKVGHKFSCLGYPLQLKDTVADQAGDHNIVYLA